MSSRRPVHAALPFATCALAASMLLLGGCSESQEQLADARFNPTPELNNLTQRPDDQDNTIHTVFDTNWRSMSRDLGVIFLLDRPSHLSPYPQR